jgi:hypothetical protein
MVVAPNRAVPLTSKRKPASVNVPPFWIRTLPDVKNLATSVPLPTNRKTLLPDVVIP